MVEDDLKHPMPVQDNELKIVHLSKFPLPVFYSKMEGIFDTGLKKTNNNGLLLKSK